MDTKKDKAIFSKLMVTMAEQFAAPVPSESFVEVRYNLLKNYEIEKIIGACEWIFLNREATFPAMPTTKEIIDAIEKVFEKKRPDRVIAEEQADLVLLQLRAYGRFYDPVFEDKITQELMTRRWRWADWAESLKEDEKKWWRKDFVEAYQDKATFRAIENSQNLIDAPDVKILDFKSKE